MKSIVMGVSGGIACYKAAEIVSALVKKGHSVDIIMTEKRPKICHAADLSDAVTKQGDHRHV